MSFSTLNYRPTGEPARPCHHSAERIETLARRAEQREFLFHPDDLVADSMIADLTAFWQLFERCQAQVTQAQERAHQTYQRSFSDALAQGLSEHDATRFAQQRANAVHIERCDGAHAERTTC